VKIRRAGDYAVNSLRRVEAPVPASCATQILFRVGAVPLNYRDILALAGEFGRHHRLPIVLGRAAWGEQNRIDIEGLLPLMIGGLPHGSFILRQGARSNVVLEESSVQCCAIVNWAARK
jgi:hypothetical protein